MAKPKEARADRGRVRLNERDLHAIEWIFDMGAIFEKDIPALVTPASPISKNAARSIVSRWEKAGVAHAEAVLAHQGRLVRLTREGRALVSGDNFVEVTLSGAVAVPGVVASDVYRAMVSRARLRIERHGIVGTQVRRWVSERQWRHQNADHPGSDGYSPNGVVHLESGELGLVHVGHTTVAVEALRPSIAELMRSFPLIVLVVPTELVSIAEEFRAALPPGQARVEVVDF